MTVTTRFIKDLEKFLEKIKDTQFQMGNKWFETPSYSIYVRVGRRILSVGNDGFIECRTLELPNMTIRQPGNGLFTDILNECEYLVARSDFVRAVYVESVIQQRFADFFVRRGYKEMPERGIGDIPSFAKYIPQHHRV